MNKKTNTIDAREKFNLSESPEAYIISLHIGNMIATYGEKQVLEIIRELFLAEQPGKRTRKPAVNE